MPSSTRSRSTATLRRRVLPIRRRPRRPFPRPLQENTYRFALAAAPSGGYVELTVTGESDTLTARVPAYLGSPGTLAGALVHFTETSVRVAGWVA